MSSQEVIGIFDDFERGRIGVKTSDVGMANLYDALENIQFPIVNIAQEIKARCKAVSLIEDFEIRIANLALDAALEGKDKNDLDLRDDIRWQVRPNVKQGLFLGQKIAKELLNG